MCPDSPLPFTGSFILPGFIFHTSPPKQISQWNNDPDEESCFRATMKMPFSSVSWGWMWIFSNLAAGGCCYENLPAVHKYTFVSLINPVLSWKCRILGALCDKGEMHLLSSLQSKGMLGKGQHHSQQSSTTRWLFLKYTLKTIPKASQSETPLLSLSEILEMAASNILGSKQHLCFSQEAPSCLLLRSQVFGATVPIRGFHRSWTAAASPAEMQQTAQHSPAAAALETHLVIHVGFTCQFSQFSNQPVHQT